MFGIDVLLSDSGVATVWICMDDKFFGMSRFYQFSPYIDATDRTKFSSDRHRYFFLFFSVTCISRSAAITIEVVYLVQTVSMKTGVWLNNEVVEFNFSAQVQLNFDFRVKSRLSLGLSLGVVKFMFPLKSSLTLI